MLKLLSAEQIKKWDSHTIQRQGITSLELMERAAKRVFEKIQTDFPQQNKYAFFCGTGNNGGDGLVIARLLKEAGKEVRVFLVGNPQNCSPDNKANQLRLPVHLNLINQESEFPKLEVDDLLIDSLFGIGLNRPPSGIFAFVIEQINQRQAAVISIDCPSGMQSDLLDQDSDSPIVQANLTLSFQIPKRAFFRGRGLKCCGKIELIDIGLDPEFLENVICQEAVIDSGTVQSFIPKRTIHAEKRQFGSVLIVGGSYGMIGSVCIAAEAALRSGAGLVTVLAPSCGYEIIQTRIPEAMVVECLDEKHLMELPNVSGFTQLAIGPGLGRHPETVRFIDQILELNRPVILDADALNIIAQENWQNRIPKGSVITPHQREFARLFGTTESEQEVFQLQVSKAAELEITIVLKGAYSRIIFPNGRVFYNSTGNPGMAKGGSGDLLTGMIAGLWARLQHVEHAVLSAVFLHGLAGDLAAKHLHEECIIASDLLHYLSDAFRTLDQTN